MARAEPEFEVFQAGKRSRRLDLDQVSLTKTNIVISEELWAPFEGVERVVFVFDRAQRILGIRKARPGEKGYKISYRSISSRSMYAYFGIEERGRFRACVEDGVLLIPLGEVVETADEKATRTSLLFLEGL